MFHIRDVTIIIGPPKDERDREYCMLASERFNESQDETWVKWIQKEVFKLVAENFNKSHDSACLRKIQKAVVQFITNKKGQTELDKIFSTIINEKVWISTLDLGVSPVRNHIYPTLIIAPENIVDKDDTTICLDWSPELMNEINSAFGIALKAEWVMTMTNIY